MATVHSVKYVTGDSGGGLESVDAFVLGPQPAEGETVAELYSIQDGTLKKRDEVPHGSAEQGHTWYTA